MLTFSSICRQRWQCPSLFLIILLSHLRVSKDCRWNWKSVINERILSSASIWPTRRHNWSTCSGQFSKRQVKSKVLWLSCKCAFRREHSCTPVDRNLRRMLRQGTLSASIHLFVICCAYVALRERKDYHSAVPTSSALASLKSISKWHLTSSSSQSRWVCVICAFCYRFTCHFEQVMKAISCTLWCLWRSTMKTANPIPSTSNGLVLSNSLLMKTMMQLCATLSRSIWKKNHLNWFLELNSRQSLISTRTFLSWHISGSQFDCL